MKKVLLLLTTLVAYVNYVNYVKPDILKLYREKESLKSSIQREIEIQKGAYTKKSLKLDYDALFFSGTRYTYSKAMGVMQNQISSSAKNVCVIKQLKWAQAPGVKKWYDRLKMDIYISCKPKDFFIFLNRLKKRKILYKIENLTISKSKKKSQLNIVLQLVAFRSRV